MLAKRKMSVIELDDKVGITMANIFRVEEWQSESNSAINIGGDL
jgi:DNA-binding Xre family transcriptional regulator